MKNSSHNHGDCTAVSHYDQTLSWDVKSPHVWDDDPARHITVAITMAPPCPVLGPAAAFGHGPGVAEAVPWAPSTVRAAGLVSTTHAVGLVSS